MNANPSATSTSARHNGSITAPKRQPAQDDASRWPEFVRRYLLHLLPKGFTRVRHYGYLAGCCRAQRVAQIREALAAAPERTDDESTSAESDACDYRCPLCKIGHLILIGEIEPRLPWSREKRRR